MIARDYKALALQYYPTDIPENEPLFLAFLNDARAEVALKAGLKRHYEFIVDPNTKTYTLPVNQGIVAVYQLHPMGYIPIWKGLPKNTPLAELYEIFESFTYDPVNHEITFHGRWKPKGETKIRVVYILYPKSFTSWDSTEQDIPERLARAVGIAFAKKMAGYDGQLELASYLEQLLLPEVGFSNVLMNA